MIQNALKKIRKRSSVVASAGIPMLGRCIDLAYLQKDVITTVEFKLRDWRRAVEQARDHRLAADYSYVCMPLRRFTERMRSHLLAAGVGLLFFHDKRDWPFETVLLAPLSDEGLDVIRAELRCRVRLARRREA